MSKYCLCGLEIQLLSPTGSWKKKSKVFPSRVNPLQFILPSLYSSTSQFKTVERITRWSACQSKDIRIFAVIEMTRAIIRKTTIFFILSSTHKIQLFDNLSRGNLCPTYA